MKAYVISICFSIILCAAADIIVPSKKYRGIVRIVCGIFVIGTIVSPIGELINFDYAALDSTALFKDSYEFFDRVSQSEQRYKDYLTQNGKNIVQDEISNEISKVFKENITAKLGDEKIILSGADPSKREDIAKYVKKHYGLDVTYDD